MKVLLIEDNYALAETLIDGFHSEGHIIDHEANGARANELLRYKKFDLVLLDMNLPGCNGYEILKSLRAQHDNTSVLVITSRTELDDHMVRLFSDAHDYLFKPFGFQELRARCQILAYRRSSETKNEFFAGNFVFNKVARRAFIEGQDLELRHREVQLLSLFIANLGRLITKQEMVDKLYSFEETPNVNAVEQIVARLRKKIENSPIQIRTIRGLGYIADIQKDIQR